MSEPTNALRVWMRFALALTLVFGTVTGSVVQVLAQDGTGDTEAVADQGTGGEVAPEAVAQAPPEALAPPVEQPVTALEPVAADPIAAEAVAAEPVAAEPVTEPAPAPAEESFADIVEDNLIAAVESEGPPSDETAQEPAPPVEDTDAQGAPVTEDASVDDSPLEAGASETTSYYDPPAPTLTTNPIFGSEAGQAALTAVGVVDESTTTTAKDPATGETESGAAEASGEPAPESGESAATAEESSGDSEAPRERSRSTDETETAQETDLVAGGSTTNESAIAATLSESTAIADGSGGSNNAAAQANGDSNNDGNASVTEKQRAEREANDRDTRRNNSDGNGGDGGNSNDDENNNNDEGNGQQDNGHRIGLLASRVAALNNRSLGGDTVAAGNGGRANASADGGIVVIGTINSGGNQGNTINVDSIGGGYGECGGGSINGGTVNNTTDINIDAGGGTAIGDASGGNGNLGLTYGDYTVLAGNGGVTRSSADGGIVIIDEINSGGNAGNTIGVGSVCGGSGGTFSIDGGTVNNTTNINIDASGGTAIADASGGDDNLAAASGDDDDAGNKRRGGLRGLIQSRYGLGGRGGLSGRAALAGNGGRANASADGGIVVIGKINSGGNRGNTINVGGIGGGYGECGPVYIDGGDVTNSTNINIDAGGGTAIADASGGNGNLAAAAGSDNGNGGGGNGGGLRNLMHSRYGLGGGGGDSASAGNGGIAGASADGGLVVINEINSGGNQGNTIEVGDICAGPVYVPEKPAKPGKPGKPGRAIKTPSIKTPAGKAPKGGRGGKVRVNKVPSTGVGHLPTAPAPVTLMPFAVLPVRREDEDGTRRTESRHN